MVTLNCLLRLTAMVILQRYIFYSICGKKTEKFTADEYFFFCSCKFFEKNATYVIVKRSLRKFAFTPNGYFKNNMK